MRVRNIAQILVVLAMAAPAGAQTPAGIVGVLDQPRPEYEAKGLPLGGFRLKPALDVGATYDDNVYATESAPKSDVYVTVAQSFSLASDWSRHMIELTGQYTRTQYASLTSESRDDGALGLDGRFDVAAGASVSGAAAISILHEPRYAPDEPGGAATPTRYALSHLELDAAYAPARFGLAQTISFNRYDYDKTPLVGGGLFNNGDRNHNQYSIAEKASVDLGGGAGIFLRGSFGAEHFDQTLDRNGLDRNSETYHADTGFNLQLTHLIEGNIFAGFVHEGYHGPFANVNSVDYGATLDWYPTDLLTVHLTAQRLYDDTTIDNAAASDDQRVGLSAEYALFRDLILKPHFDYTVSDFVGIVRQDQLMDTGIDATLLLNRVMSLDASYRFTRRVSNAPGADFNDNSVGAGLHLQL